MSMVYQFSIPIPNGTVEYNGKQLDALEGNYQRFVSSFDNVDGNGRTLTNRFVFTNTDIDKENKVQINKGESSIGFKIQVADGDEDLARTYINAIVGSLGDKTQERMIKLMHQGANNAEAKNVTAQKLAEVQRKLLEASNEPLNTGKNRSVTNSFDDHRTRPRANAISNPKQGMSLDGVIDFQPELEPELDIDKLKRYYQQELMDQINKLNQKYKALNPNSEKIVNVQSGIEAGTVFYSMQNGKSDSPDSAMVAINKNFKASAKNVSPESVAMLEASAKAFLAARTKVLGPDAPPYEFTLTCESVEQGKELKERFESAGLIIKDPIKYNTPQPEHSLEKMPNPMDDSNKLDDSSPRQRQKLTQSLGR